MSISVRKKLLSITLAMLSSFTVSYANAALSSVDYVVNSGDNWITSDSLTGLQWLDVPLTANQTFDQVRQGEWFANGFRFATKTELQTLFINAGTPDDGFDTRTTHYFETRALINLLGATLNTGGVTNRLSTFGYIGTSLSNEDLDLNNLPLGLIFSAYFGKLDSFIIPFSEPVPVGEAHFTGGHSLSNTAEPTVGSFLVRMTPVPEPETYCLMLVGLGFVGFIVRRRKS